MVKKNKITSDNEAVSQVTVPQGSAVLFWGIFGVILALMPAIIIVFPNNVSLNPWILVAIVAWACFVGWPITYQWSKALHKRIAILRKELIRVGGLLEDEKKSYPGRVPWMPAWIGLFERALYSILIGVNVEGGAAFIGVWVGLKLAGGWQLWSKGTTYGRAIFFSGLLGNAMSVLFGLVAGLVIRALIP